MNFTIKDTVLNLTILGIQSHFKCSISFLSHNENFDLHVSHHDDNTRVFQFSFKTFLDNTSIKPLTTRAF